MIQKNVDQYYQTLAISLADATARDEQARLFSLSEGIEKVIDMILKKSAVGGKLIFIGNGASASISSHQAVDFWKGTGIPALCFNDAALLTCISNDFGYDRVFEKPLELFLKPQDILFAISSSGKSENVLRAAKLCRKRQASLITLSGFKSDNPLRKLGKINFYVPALSYGIVEVAHHSILHCLLDTLIKSRKK